MRMNLPSIRVRRSIDQGLTDFFREYRESEFRRAIAALSRFYSLRSPRIEWYEYLDWGKSAGRTYDTGKIHLVHPEHWKRGRKYNSERQWINAVYHEMGHYLLWVDPERKADSFAYRFVRGTRRRNGQSTPTRRASAIRSRPRRRPRRSRSR